MNETNNNLNKLRKKIYLPKRLEQMNEINFISLYYLINNKLKNGKKKLQFMFYDKELKLDRPIEQLNCDKDFLDKKVNFHISINPIKQQSISQITSIFNYVKNQYGFWLYGRDWTKKLNLNYTMAIEQENNRHIHLIVFNMSINEMYLFLAFFYLKMREFWKSVDIYCKICDTLDPILYDIKNKDTIIINQDYFIKA